jgi:leucyl-tRNA synthetase
MAVPAHDQRDFEFADEFTLPVVTVVQPPTRGSPIVGSPGAPASEWPEAFTATRRGRFANDDVSLDGLGVADATQRVIEWLDAQEVGAAAITYKLRDWLFSRQRYWGEPFPIVYDDAGLPVALPESMLPVELPEIDDFAPRILADDTDLADDGALPEPPLARAEEWVTVELDLGDGVRAGWRPTPCRSGQDRAGTTALTDPPPDRSSTPRTSGGYRMPGEQ